MPREPKLQRWTDLIAALLRRNFVATFEELARDVPAYSDESKKKDAIMRMFERDKDELRAFGISIDTVDFQGDDGDASGYRLDRRGFYLPYLSLSASGGKPASSPRKIEKHWYRALASLVFEPDELTIIAQAAQRVRALGDSVLAEEADSAIRKLSFDLPIPDAGELDQSMFAVMSPVRSSGIEEPWGYHESPVAVRENVFELLNDALTRRKAVSFEYHSMSSNSDATRTVEPYGLFFLSSHWYLAGRDADKNEMRNFRLNRMRNLSVNTSRSQRADYEIPSTFHLRDHAQSRRPWDLGDGDANEAIVDFSGASGAAKAAARLGVAVEGGPNRRKFSFKRLDSFARWLMSFGGEAVPIAPASLVSELERQVSATQSAYAPNR